jgi:hypothetical protein
VAEGLTPTAEEGLFIEEQRLGYVRYVRPATGERWEIEGTCDRRGLCMVGAVIDGVQVRDLDHLAQMVLDKGTERLDSELDVAVTPEFTGCCPLRGRWLS